MTITCNKSYRQKATGPDWELMSDVSMKDTEIIYALESYVISNKEVCFSKMHDLLKSRYARKKERSKCTIINNPDYGTIEVCGKSLMFPRFFIVKALLSVAY